jgi:hypothetical protein
MARRGMLAFGGWKDAHFMESVLAGMPTGDRQRGERSMRSSHTTADGIPSWLEQQYCASVAAALLARNEYFELLEDAMTSPAQVVQALHAWREHAYHAHAWGGLVGTA